jgi:hypothetical protein
MSRNSESPIKAGEALGPFEYTITEEMVDMHLKAVDNKDPLFKDLQSDRRRLVPPCFSVRDFVYLLLQKEALSMSGIQTEQESEYFTPGFVGQRVVCRGKVVDQYIKRGRKYNVIDYWIDDINGQPVAKHRLTGIIFGKRRKRECH